MQQPQPWSPRVPGGDGTRLARILLFDEVDAARALGFADVEAPEPGIGEIRYRVNAFALNRSDLLFLNDEHYSVATLPSRIGTEACGVVDAVGPDITRFAVGYPVTSIPYRNTAGTNRNVAGEFALTPERYLMAWPTGLPAPEACSLTMQYLTAYSRSARKRNSTQAIGCL